MMRHGILWEIRFGLLGGEGVEIWLWETVTLILAIMGCVYIGWMDGWGGGV